MSTSHGLPGCSLRLLFPPDIEASTSPEVLSTICDTVYDAMTSTAKVPAHDICVVVSKHDADDVQRRMKAKTLDGSARLLRMMSVVKAELGQGKSGMTGYLAGLVER
jgi:hypothetical protein